LYARSTRWEVASKMLNDDRGAPAQTTESSRDFAPSKSKREDTAGDVQYTITSQQVNKPTSHNSRTVRLGEALAVGKGKQQRARLLSTCPSLCFLLTSSVREPVSLFRLLPPAIAAQKPPEVGWDPRASDAA